MSVQTPTTYNPEQIVFSIDGTSIEGFSEEGIQIERDGKTEITEGMDSGVTIDVNASRMCKVTVSLRAASKGARDLQAIKDSIDADLQGGLAYPRVSGYARDPINESSVGTATAVFLNQPHPNFASKAGNVVYEFAFLNYDYTVASDVPD